MAKVAFIVGEGFEDSEFQVPFDRLKQAGHDIELLGERAKTEVRGKHGKAVARIDISAQGADADNYAALVIPGGHSPDHLRTNKDIVALVRDFMTRGKPVAAICHGPQLLIEAGSVKGRTLTSWPSVKTDLINAGANWVDKEMVEDRNLITSRKPDDLAAFCTAIETALQEASAQRSHKPQLSGETPNIMRNVKMDEEGFLINIEEWNEELALWLAKQEGLDVMSEARWRVIYALREFYQAHHHVPNFRQLCEAAQQDDNYCLERLFDNNGSKAWRIAGLPNPGEEIKAYL